MIRRLGGHDDRLCKSTLCGKTIDIFRANYVNRMAGIPTRRLGDRLQMVGRPTRPGFHTVTPYLIARELEPMVEFLKQAFGATDKFHTRGEAYANLSNYTLPQAANFR